jgi:hypothetical protein
LRTKAFATFSPISVLLIAGYFILGNYIFKYSLDVPLLDEWDVWWTWQPGNIWSWIFERHNEHRIVFTRLEFLLVNYFARGNEIYLIALNYFIFGLLVLVFRKVIKRFDPTKYGSEIFLLFLFCNLPYENHLWGFQSQFHFALLFFWTALMFLFEGKQRWASLAAGILFLVASAFSFSFGVASALVAALAFAGFKVERLLSRGAYRRREISQLVVVVGFILFGLLAWGRGFHQLAGHPAVSYPWRPEFWRFFLRMISFAFGNGKIDSVLGRWSSLLWGGIFFTLTLASWSYVLVKKRLVDTPTRWLAVAAVGGVLAAAVSVAAGRAGFELSFAKSSRYTELTLMLVPLCATGLVLSFRKSLFLFFILLVPFAHKFDATPFRDYYALRLNGQRCLKKFVRFGGNGYCPDLYPVPLAEKLESVQNYSPSFLEGW